MKNNFLSDYSFIISFHEAIPVGPAYDLRKFLILNSVKKIFFISHPLLYNRDARKNSSWYEYLENGKIGKKGTTFHWKLPDPLLYLKDLLYTLVWCLSLSGSYKVFIGLNPLNALSGIILKRIGKVEKVVYYSIDYFPNRFTNKILNNLYHQIDKICVKFCDETWNLSKNMELARKISYKQFTVPIGIWFNRTKRRTFSKINKKKLVFIGYVDVTSGIEMAIRVLPKILLKIPNVRLEIIGSGPEEQKLKKLSRDLNLKNNLIFHGWVTNREKVEKLLSDGAVGLVLFNTRIFKNEVKNADPMKLKDYMVLGLTVITIDAVSNKKAIIDSKSGIVIQYDRKQLEEAIIRLLTDDKMLREYRRNALNYVKQFDIEKIYRENLNRVLNK